MFLGPLVLIAVITAIVLAVQRNARHGDAAPRRTAPPTEIASEVGRSDTLPDTLPDTLGRWVADDLISAEQAQAILQHERTGAAAPATGRAVEVPGSRRRIPVFAEALGYLGGVLALAGLTLLVRNYWPDLPTPVRLLLSLLTTVALVGAGALVNEASDPALARLRWFLWTLSSATAALFTGVLMVDGFDVGTPAFVVAACAGAIALTSALLWQGQNRPIQELLVFAAVIVSAATSVAGFTNAGVGGLTAWFLAAAALAVGLRGLTGNPLIPHVVGTIAIMAGAFATVSEWMGAGALVVLATASGLLVLAALPHVTMDVFQRVPVVVVAGIGVLQGAPMTLAYFANEAGGATGLVTWAVGGTLIAVGVLRLLRAPIVAELIGGLGVIGGAALTGTQWPDLAPLFGLGTAMTLLVIGMLPGRVLYSLLGSLGLLINVPWTIGRFFPGEGRAPLLILMSGVLIVVVAVMLARQGDRLRTELRLHGPRSTLTATATDVGRRRHESMR